MLTYASIDTTTHISLTQKHPQTQTDSYLSRIYPVWSHHTDAPLVLLVINKDVRSSTERQRWGEKWLHVSGKCVCEVKWLINMFHVSELAWGHRQHCWYLDTHSHTHTHELVLTSIDIPEVDGGSDLFVTFIRRMSQEQIKKYIFLPSLSFALPPRVLHCKWALLLLATHPFMNAD